MEKNNSTSNKPNKVAHEVFRKRRKVSQAGLRLRVSERKPLLFLVDLSIINLALMIALAISTDFVISPKVILLTSRWFLILTGVWYLTAIFFDCYNLALAASTLDSLRNSNFATIATILIYTFIPFLTPPLQSRGLLLIFSGLAVSGIALWRLTYAKIFVQPQFVQRSIIVGAGKNSSRFSNRLRMQHQ